MSLAPRYFVFARCGRALISVERDVNDLDLNTTVRDIAGGQIDRPESVWCADDNRFYDASDEVAQAVADYGARCGFELPRPVLEWLSEYCGLRVAYALGMEAA